MNQLVQLSCRCIGSTDKAIKIRTVDGRETWIPQSQIHDDSEVWKQDQEGRLVIPEFVAASRGLKATEYVAR